MEKVRHQICGALKHWALRLWIAKPKSGVLSNAVTPPGVQTRLIDNYPILLDFLITMCTKGTLHARYIAAGCLRKLSNTVPNVER